MEGPHKNSRSSCVKHGCVWGDVTEWLSRGWTNKFNSHWYSKMKECNFCLAKVAAWLFCYESFLKSTTITDSNGETGKASGRWTSPHPHNNTTVCAHTFFRFVFNPFGVKSGPIISIITACSLPIELTAMLKLCPQIHLFTLAHKRDMKHSNVSEGLYHIVWSNTAESMDSYNRKYSP